MAVLPFVLVQRILVEQVDDKEARQERVSNYTVKKENIAMSTEIFNVTQQTPNQLLTIRKKICIMIYVNILHYYLYLVKQELLIVYY